VSDENEAPEPPDGDGSPKKDRVLHTRVPEVLEQELKRLAKSLRVPVSNVVRVILEDAVDTVDVVGQRAEGELRGVAERLSRERDRMRARRRRGSVDGEPEEPEDEAPDGPRPPLEGVIGAVCAEPLAKGDEAFLGIREGGRSRVIVSKGCLPLSAEEDRDG